MHVHTSRCRHATGSPADYVAAAEAAGVTTMAFTDHLPLPEGFDGSYAMPEVELAEYVVEVARARGTARATEVLLGIEADWLPEHLERARTLIGAHPFDVVLGSVHFVDGWAFDDPALRDGYSQWTPDALWERYFDELGAAASSGLFDAMAHPDLVKKFRFVPESDPRGWYSDAAAAFAAAGVAVEVSTAGLRKPCGEIYPSASLLSEMRRAGVPAMVGSDAHRPAEVGYGWHEAYSALRRAGYTSVVVFRERVAEEVPLP